jgi:predicted nucleic acid-binding protein
MITLVDTSVWSLALRRRRPDLSRYQQEQVHKLEELLIEDRAKLLGAIRQEVLSGIKSVDEFVRLRRQLRAFPDVEIETTDYEEAAQIGNNCRTHGIAATPTDMLLCAVALRRGWAIYTSDRDFEHYAKYVPIVLFS